MATFRDALREGSRGAVCTLLTDPVLSQSIGLSLSRKGAGAGLGFTYTPGGTARLYCDDPLEPLEPPFTGGQCDGELYRVEVRFNDSLGNPQVFQPQLFGPIGPVETFPDEVNPQNLQIRAFGRFTPTGPIQPATAGPLLWDGGQPTVLVVPIDHDDDCGDPDPIIPPPFEQSDPILVPVTYNNREGDEITENANFNIFAPVFVPNVGVSFPVRIDLPDVQIDGDLVLGPNGDVNLNINPVPRPPEPLPVPDRPPIPGEEETPPEEGNSIIGAIALVGNPDEAGASTISTQNGVPEIAAPALGWVAFAISARGVTSWTADIPIKSVFAYIPCPVDFGATAVRGTPRRGGATVTVFPVFGVPLQRPPA